MTSVGDDVWRRIFDRCGWLAKLVMSLVIRQMQHRLRNRLQLTPQVRYVQVQASGPRLIAQTGTQRPQKGCHTGKAAAAAPLLFAREPVLADRHGSGDGSGCAFKIVRGQISARPTLARAGGSGAADPADSTLGGTLACRSHRWSSTP